MSSLNLPYQDLSSYWFRYQVMKSSGKKSLEEDYWILTRWMKIEIPQIYLLGKTGSSSYRAQLREELELWAIITARIIPTDSEADCRPGVIVEKVIFLDPCTSERLIFPHCPPFDAVIPVVLILTHSELSPEQCTELARGRSGNLIRGSIMYSSHREPIARSLMTTQGYCLHRAASFKQRSHWRAVGAIYWRAAATAGGETEPHTPALLPILAPSLGAFFLWGYLCSHLPFAFSVSGSHSSPLLSPFPLSAWLIP